MWCDGSSAQTRCLMRLYGVETPERNATLGNHDSGQRREDP
jgi:hypothetical protein